MHQQKYKRISVMSSETETNYLIQEIIGNANKEISIKNVIRSFPGELAKQIVAA